MQKSLNLLWFFRMKKIIHLPSLEIKKTLKNQNKDLDLEVNFWALVTVKLTVKKKTPTL